MVATDIGTTLEDCHQQLQNAMIDGCYQWVTIGDLRRKGARVILGYVPNPLMYYSINATIFPTPLKHNMAPDYSPSNSVDMLKT